MPLPPWDGDTVVATSGVGVALRLVDGADLEDRVIPLSTLLAATNPRLSGTAYAAGREYWLARCEGFRVLSDEGTIGVTERVGYRRSVAPAAFLLVRGGCSAPAPCSSTPTMCSTSMRAGRRCGCGADTARRLCVLAPVCCPGYSAA